MLGVCNQGRRFAYPTPRRAPCACLRAGQVRVPRYEWHRLSSSDQFFGQILQDYEHVSPVVILNDTEIIHCQLSALKWIIWDVQPVLCGH